MTKSIHELKKLIAHFVKERDWEQFHSPKNLSIAVSTEAAELMELFTWIDSDKSMDLVKKKNAEVRHEVADVFIAALSFCVAANLDPEKIILEKLEEIKKKYPVDKAKGKCNKYSDYL